MSNEYFGFRSKIVGTKAAVNRKLLQGTKCVGTVFWRGKQIGQYFGECFARPRVLVSTALAV
jgi:hypothetical protein